MKTWVVGVGIAGCIAVAGSAIYILADSGDDSIEQADAAGRSSRKGKRKSKRDRGWKGSDWDGGAGSGDLESRVAELEREVKDLKKALRTKQAFSPPRGGDDSFDLIADSEDPVFDSRVRELVADERERERDERRERRSERMSEMRTELLDGLVAKASLSDTQREEIDGLWTGETEAIMGLIEEARAGERNFGEVRQEIDELRKATDEQVKEMLDADQYETYLEERPMGPGGRPGGRPGGSGGGGRPPAP